MAARTISPAGEEGVSARKRNGARAGQREQKRKLGWSEQRKGRARKRRVAANALVAVQRVVVTRPWRPIP